MSLTDPTKAAYTLALAAAKEAGKARRAAEAKERTSLLLGDAEHMITEAIRFIAYAQQAEPDSRLH